MAMISSHYKNYEPNVTTKSYINLMQKLKAGNDPLQGLSVAERLEEMDNDVVLPFGKEFIQHS